MDSDNRHFGSYRIGRDCPCGLDDFLRRRGPASGAFRPRFKTSPQVVDVYRVKRRAFAPSPGVVWAMLFLTMGTWTGCTVARVAGAGVKLGAAAVKTGVRAGGAAVGLTGSALGMGGDDAEEDENPGAEKDLDVPDGSDRQTAQDPPDSRA